MIKTSVVCMICGSVRIERIKVDRCNQVITKLQSHSEIACRMVLWWSPSVSVCLCAVDAGEGPYSTSREDAV